MKQSITIKSGFSSSAGKKEINQDSCGVVEPTGCLMREKGIIAAIADGMSSSAGAKEASETSVKALLNDYLDTPNSWTVKTAATQVLTAANRWLCAQGQSEHHSSLGMASTLTGLIIKGKTAHIFHIGDSRIYMLRSGVLTLLTEDHRENTHKGNSYLSRAMGTDVNLKVDYHCFEIFSEDIFLFTTDGVHESLSDEAMAETILQHCDTLDDCANIITSDALSGGSLDNVTCLLLKIEEVSDAVEKNEITNLAFPPDLNSGMILDGYKIIRELHSSNRSQLYLAEDTETGELTALKTPSINYEDNASYIESFQRESWISKQVSSPHIMKVKADRDDKKFLYTALEYIEGQSLREWMRDNPQPQLSKVRDITEQLTKGLRALHRREIIHQDIKPENIMITESGTVIIIDFGSAKSMGLEEIAPIINIEHGIGTVNYSAPEMLLGFRTTPSSDLYSLATITYELLTGALPYNKALTSQRRTMNATYIPVSTHRDDIPFWVDRALKKALSVRREERQDVLSAYMHDLNFPNPKFRTENRPLLERNPVAFWKATTFILAALLIGVLVS